jgi:hypothetical protein
MRVSSAVVSLRICSWFTAFSRVRSCGACFNGVSHGSQSLDLSRQTVTAVQLLERNHLRTGYREPLRQNGRVSDGVTFSQHSVEVSHSAGHKQRRGLAGLVKQHRFKVLIGHGFTPGIKKPLPQYRERRVNIQIL